MTNLQSSLAKIEQEQPRDDLWLIADIERLIEQIEFSVKLRDAVTHATVRDAADGLPVTDDLTASMMETAVLCSCGGMLEGTLRLLREAAKLRPLIK